jgi:oligopeptide/dipeptide ABC transporter ATP-binding protein
VADEPVSALDVSVQAQVLNLLVDLRQNFGLTYLFVAHDLAVVEYVCQRIAVMYVGKIVELAPANELLTHPLHPYTETLLKVIPKADPLQKKRERAVGGEVPDPANPPAGCYFHPRCTYAKEVCVHEPPLAVDPENLDVLIMAGQMSLMGENYEKAAELLERVVAQRPEDIDTLFNLAECYRNLGKVDEAVDLFLKSVQANPQDSDAWYRLGRIYEKQGKYKDSIEALNMVVSLKATSVQGWQALSRSWALLSNVQSEGGMDDAASTSAKKAEEAYNMSVSLQDQAGE